MNPSHALSSAAADPAKQASSGFGHLLDMPKRETDPLCPLLLPYALALEGLSNAMIAQQILIRHLNGLSCLSVDRARCRFIWAGG